MIGWPTSRQGWGIAGGIALGIAWLSPLPALAGRSFSAHMTLHMLIVAIAAPLISLSIAGSRFDPARRWPRLFAAIPASVGELFIVWAWHMPWLHLAARHSTVGFAAEQATFLLAGIWLWVSALGGPLPRSRWRSGAGVVGLLLTSIHMTLLGALLALSPRPLLSHPMHAAGPLTPMQDLHLGGAIMLVVGGIVYLAGGVYLTIDLAWGQRPMAHPCSPSTEVCR